MSESPGQPQRYRVSYSGRVREELRALLARARGLGRAPEVLAAVKEIDRRLQIYPQFGQPLRDLTLEPAQVWIGVVPPLTVQYVLDEARHAVFVVVPLLPLPSSGL